MNVKMVEGFLKRNPIEAYYSFKDDIFTIMYHDDYFELNIDVNLITQLTVTAKDIIFITKFGKFSFTKKIVEFNFKIQRETLFDRFKKILFRKY